jgi:chorismate mutase
VLLPFLQLDKAAADAAEFKAGFDKYAADAAEYKAGVDKLSADNAEQQAQLDKAEADAAEYKAGYDKLLSDTTEQKAQVGAAGVWPCLHHQYCAVLVDNACLQLLQERHDPLVLCCGPAAC